LQGDLTRETLADVIRTLYVDRRSGILHLAQGKTSKRIYFRKGSMIFANSDVESDRLGEFLIRQGVIDRSSFEETTEKMKDTGHRFGRTVVELGYCTAEGMEQKVVEQIQAIIYSLFDWDAGDYRFEQHEHPVDEDIILNLSTADIILEGARRLGDIEKVRRALGDSSGILEQNEDPLLLYQKMTTLSQSEYFILSRVDGTSSMDDIFAVSPLPEDETLRCIYGLVSAGVLVLKGGPRAESSSGRATPTTATPPAKRTPAPPAATPKPDPPAPKPAATPRPAVSAPKRSSAGRPPVATTEPPPKPEGPSPEEIAVRDDITQKHASLSDSNLYDLLGITITANEDEIKKAYYAMAKKYHPDRHHSAHLRDVHGLLEELFSKITHAYQTLSSTAERHRYDQTVKHGDGGVAASVGDGVSSKKAEHATEAALKRQAEQRYAEGKQHYDEMHFFDAIQSLREAIRLYPKKQYHKLLAQALMKNPLWGKEAEEHFLAALKMDQFDAECALGLGQIYEDRGMMTRAQKMYEQAATYDPENQDVQNKIEAKKDSGGLGGFKRLFGRKKE
jgi:curved DNA-binding protein CbpA